MKKPRPSPERTTRLHTAPCCPILTQPAPPRKASGLTPRHRRILLALLVRDRNREEVDRISGASNSPDEILRIRRQFGLSIPCQRKGSKDRDGHPVQVGIYRLTDADCTAARRLLGGAA